MTDHPDDEPVFLDDDGPSAEIPPFITTTNARELYALRPGETVSEAIARTQRQGLNQIGMGGCADSLDATGVMSSC